MRCHCLEKPYIDLDLYPRTITPNDTEPWECSYLGWIEGMNKRYIR